VAVATVGAVDRITWDPEKERQNWAKHGVSFAEAGEAILDPEFRMWPDTSHSREEARSIVVGKTNRLRLLTVVIVDDEQGTIRVISARRATKRERYAYEAF
jgi:uncharacterized DUF497 family protein